MRKDYLYSSDKKQIHEMKLSVHSLKKKLPDSENVKNLLITKKKVHNKCILGIEESNIKINPGLANLHYSEAGETPRESDHKAVAFPPEKLVTPFESNITKNVEKAFDYKPFKEERPKFDT